MVITLLVWYVVAPLKNVTSKYKANCCSVKVKRNRDVSIMLWSLRYSFNFQKSHFVTTLWYDLNYNVNALTKMVQIHFNNNIWTYDDVVSSGDGLEKSITIVLNEQIVLNELVAYPPRNNPCFNRYRFFFDSLFECTLA